jgi:hypothetical protein
MMIVYIFLKESVFSKEVISDFVLTEEEKCDYIDI